MTVPVTDIDMRHQVALYWAQSGNPSDFGQLNFDTAVEVECRWQDVSEKFVTPEGDEKVSRAKVFPDREMKPGDYLLYTETLASAAAGTALAAFTGDTDNPRANPDAVKIEAFKRIPFLDNDQVLYIAML